MRKISGVLATAAAAAIAIGVMAGPATAFPTEPSSSGQQIGTDLNSVAESNDMAAKCAKKSLSYKDFRKCMQKAEPSGQAVDDDDYDAPGGY